MTAITFRFHRWQGFARSNLEPDLFHFVVKAGFVTVYIEKKSLLEAYRKLRTTIEEVVGREEGQ
ncbi:MAG: hypothetical protein K0R61_21 [Microvirga sp.]|jgi:hypothetical protein|nr:hypothetical protein [Microvirga sp.]MDF2969571.1 hypothetical protein [Microvirga sp.]